MENAVANKIVGKVSEVTGVSTLSVYSRHRGKSVIYARFIAIGLMRNNTGMSLDEIGCMFLLDHTTVLAAQRRCEGLRKTDPLFMATYAKAARGLNGVLIEHVPRLDRGSPSVTRANEILVAVAEASRLPMSDLLGNSRVMKVVEAKRVAIALLREMTPLSYVEIAAVMCLANHSTAITAIKRFRSADRSAYSIEVEADARAALAKGSK